MASVKRRHMSVKVDCVATGRRHDDREVCGVAVVDDKEKVLLIRKVKPKSPVVSYITPLTGVRAGDLDDASKLEDVIKEVKELVGPDVILVGQGIKNDIQWLNLKEGEDYDSIVDLAEMFKTRYNSRYGNFNYYTLSHEANTLIQPGFISEPHKPETNAMASIRLFNMFHGKPTELTMAMFRLKGSRPPPSFAKKHNYNYEGVCMAAFYPAKCFCGAPTKRT